MHAEALAGKRILITRAAEQQPATRDAIEARGAVAIAFPCLALQCLPEQIRACLPTAASYTDVLFTSANGVHCVIEGLGRDTMAQLLAGKRIAAVGARTAATLRQHGVTVDLLPNEASQEGLLAAYRQHGLPQQLLFFRAEDGRELLAEELTRLGCRVSLVAAYRTVCPEDDAGEVRAMLAKGGIDAVLLGSPRTAAHYVQRIGDAALAGRAIIVAISVQVAEAAHAAGLEVHVVAKDASFEAMLDALADYFSPRQGDAD